ncbi:MAG: hypothetical protein MKZ95_08675, partial [Pirellulales bacterium]|nr:hypothetical protein [Pirellulales bacterium]
NLKAHDRNSLHPEVRPLHQQARTYEVRLRLRKNLTFQCQILQQPHPFGILAASDNKPPRHYVNNL